VLHLVGGRPRVSDADAASEEVKGRLKVVFDALSSTYDAIVFDGGALHGQDGARSGRRSPPPVESALVVTVSDGPAGATDARGLLERLGARDIATVAAPQTGPGAGGLAAA